MQETPGPAASPEKTEKKKKNGRGRRIFVSLLAAAAIIAGISMALYAPVATWINDRAASSTVDAYEEEIGSLDDSEIDNLEQQAREYNEALAYNVSLYGEQEGLTDAFSGSDEGSEEYRSLLNTDGSGVMGYIDIPSIGVYYPVYHGTSDTVLQAGIGHLAGSSLPVGGENTHAVFTGHTGITTNRLFTDLDEMEVGDLFYIHVLGKVLAYEVTEIQVVTPDDTAALRIREGEDLVTLVTCTPYGVNSHRLFVTGTRTEYSEAVYEQEVEKRSETSSLWMDEYIRALLIGLGVALGLTLLIIIIRVIVGRKNGKKTRIPWRGILGVFILVLGIGIYAWPYLAETALDYMTDSAVSEFEAEYGTEDAYSEAAETGADISSLLEGDALWQACLSYNMSIFAAGQSALSSATAYEKSQISLSLYDGFDEDSAFGYIEIPSMDVTLPLYLGATTEHMALGAAVMGQTSVPIGGSNTNSVIVGHRGYRGSPYFREIEKLSVGDYVYVTNPWGTLAYRVTSTDIISKHDSESIKIQEGKDMITLLTCHPYRSHGKYRWVVFCERDTEEEARLSGGSAEAVTETETTEGTEDGTVEEGTGYVTASDGTIYPTSEADIIRENRLRSIAGISIICIMLLAGLRELLYRIRRRHRLKKERKARNGKEEGQG